MELKLSPHQERIWFIDHFERGQVYPHPPVYHNLPLVIRGKGNIPAAMARAALERIVSRHEVLRTRIVERAVPATQTIAPESTFPWQETTLERDTSEASVIAHLVAANLVPFQLDRQPLLRSEFVRCGDCNPDYWWLITLHHVIADRPTLRFLAEEIGGALGGAAPVSPDFHYPDYVEWQRELPPDAMEPLLFHWKWQLRGRIPPLELPTARPRVAVHTFTGARHTFTWSAATTAILRTMATSRQTTLSAVALALFTVLLHRYARQDEIVIGTSAPNRRPPGTAGLMGPVANLVVLRSQLAGNPAWTDFLTVFAHTLSDALEHQEMPFDSLVRALNPAKDMSRTALFDVLATVDETPLPAFELGAELGSGHMLDLNLGQGKYDLALHLQIQADETIAGTLTYNTDLHDEGFVTQLARHLERLAQAVAAAPTTGIAELPLLDDAEKQQLRHAFNDSAAAAPRDETLASLFAAQIAAHPDHTALTCGDVQLTYRELDQRANQLAHHLQSQLVAPNQLVAVALDRSPALIIALLGVLKAGAGYLPLDPDHPLDRITFTLEDAAVRHLITTETLAERIRPPASVSAITLLDRQAEQLSALATTAPEVASRPAHLAYCIYTSGSTGRPKGALIEHRQVVRLLCNDRSAFDFQASDVWTLFHSACFDFSVWEMYGALLFGGRLVIVPADTARDPAAFATLLATQGVTILNQTPSAFRQLSAELARRQHPALALRLVIFGGEALAPLHLRDFAAAYPDVDLINMYGITETTVHVTYHRITPDDIAENRPIIGRPIPTTTTLIMDERSQLVPLGVPGEICVGGEGLARGYLRREELTREKFIAHPYEPGQRLYRSGDLGRLQADGTMLHLGRIDDQVQVRGFRVELGEIQTRLLQHPAVTAAEVVARDRKDGTTELVSYLVAKTAVTTAALRHHVADTLPDYMVPNTFVLLETMPVTVNGKIDRRALPDPAESLTASGPVFSPPVGDVECFLADTFAALLSVENVGRDHHFFELGGHSLLAAQLVSRLRERFHVEIPLRHVFESPSVAALATVITSARSSVTASATDSPTAIPRAARRVAAPAALTES
ncbi:non-ribosomal peptide synthetase [Synoicihabitans lomoniglobus]|uniref:Amino acid adenylation domain-containing protein n=1 Tax=Synoicihabitans lomoniglobus TaxID=2909285 RepID=A0AAE9ZYH9_9BACT|nr:amino acid adenylation domain-containing protein [Opitutaceae bacterium LMO-M01]WED65709.1 amino acid adenylation domain-containing protein [Opitutaceae bacterium LMO-M01]